MKYTFSLIQLSMPVSFLTILLSYITNIQFMYRHYFLTLPFTSHSYILAYACTVSVLQKTWPV